MIGVTPRQALINKIRAPVVQSQIKVMSVNTTYLTAGDGPPVICLHGAGAGAVTWYPSIDALADNFTVVAPDIVGYGESDKPEAPYDRTYFAAWLKGFMTALGIQKAHIVGLSQGGGIALQFALEHGDMVDKLVLVDSGALGARPSFWAFVSMLWMNNFPSAAASRFQSRFLLVDTSKRDPNHGDYSVEVLKKPGGKNAFSQGRGAAVSPMSEHELRQIDNQTLIMWGQNDNFFAIEHGEAAARIMPCAKLQPIANAGHLALMDQSEAFNRALLGFLLGGSATTNSGDPA